MFCTTQGGRSWTSPARSRAQGLWCLELRVSPARSPLARKSQASPQGASPPYPVPRGQGSRSHKGPVGSSQAPRMTVGRVGPLGSLAHLTPSALGPPTCAHTPVPAPLSEAGRGLVPRSGLCIEHIRHSVSDLIWDGFSGSRMAQPLNRGSWFRSTRAGRVAFHGSPAVVRLVPAGLTTGSRTPGAWPRRHRTGEGS